MSTQQQQGSVLAHVAGVYVASAFANWKMQISQGPVLAASPATFNLATGSFTLQDGTEISIPFTVGAPITIGNGAAQETVNVTAFNGTGTGAAYGQATVSANTSNTHGSGEPIISGSAGLCEACALCASQGGGIVVRHLAIAGAVANALGKEGFASLLPKNKLGTPDEIRESCIRFGGELLEAFELPRGAWDGREPQVPKAWRYKQTSNFT